MGLIVGLASAAAMVKWPPGAFVARADQWRVSSDFGSSQANLWLKAHVALTGLFALPAREAIYFVADRDSEGQAFSGHCRYQVAGAVPQGGWASLTAYDSEGFLIGNPGKKFSVRLVPGGNAPPIDVAAKQTGTDWLPVRDGEAFSLMLRIYEPAPELARNLATVPLPTVTRVGCDR
jgi:hypothetical protein